MRNSMDKTIVAMIFFLIGIYGAIFYIEHIVTDNNRWYRQGQMDAIQGKIKYHLVEQEDGTTKWKRKDDNS